MTDDVAPGSWTLIDVRVHPDTVELVSDALWRMGAQAIEERNGDREDRVCLRTSMGTDIEAVRSMLVAEFAGLSVEPVEISRDVADSWRAHVRPTWIDERHVVVPAWVQAPSAEVCVRIEPGDQFGLGNHETTILAARLLLGSAGEGELWADVGSGSGVLALLGALSRRTRFLVTDIAPGSRTTIEDNARLNGCADLVTWCTSLDEIPRESVDGVVANILSPVLRDIAGDVMGMVRPGGTIVLSGTLASQVGEVCERYRPTTIVAQASLGPWSAVALRRGT